MNPGYDFNFDRPNSPQNNAHEIPTFEPGSSPSQVLEQHLGLPTLAPSSPAIPSTEEEQTQDYGLHGLVIASTEEEDKHDFGLGALIKPRVVFATEEEGTHDFGLGALIKPRVAPAEEEYEEEGVHDFGLGELIKPRPATEEYEGEIHNFGLHAFIKPYPAEVQEPLGSAPKARGRCISYYSHLNESYSSP